MAAIIGSPTRYIQGKGEMKNLCSYADKFGKNLFILTSASGRKRVEPAINEGNKDSNLVYDVFNGECCMTEINRIIKIVEEAGSDVIIGIGGGKILLNKKPSDHRANDRIYGCTMQCIICYLYR